MSLVIPTNNEIKTTGPLVIADLFNSLTSIEKHILREWLRINENNPTLYSKRRKIVAGLKYLCDASGRQMGQITIKRVSGSTAQALLKRFSYNQNNLK